MEFFKKYKKHIIIGGVLLLFLVASIIIYYRNNNNNKDNNNTKLVDAVVIEKEESPKEEEGNSIEPVYEECYVDIKGAVINPGVYNLSCNARVNDVVNLAGGVSENADTRCVNLSKKIKDEMVIYIYTKDEVIDMYKEDKKEDKVIFKDIINDAYVDYTNPDNNITSDNEISSSETITSKININTADISQLTTLPNIGESKAQAIIDKRNELGKFTSIEQLKEVSGIGDATFEKLKDLITIDD